MNTQTTHVNQLYGSNPPAATSIAVGYGHTGKPSANTVQNRKPNKTLSIFVIKYINESLSHNVSYRATL